MELSEAIALIQNDHLPPSGPGIWADLGCGSGMFTFALAHLLKPGSTIHAVDKDPVILKPLPNPNGIAIHTLQLDFVADTLPLPPLDGILMANSLHFVSDKITLLNKLTACLKPGGCFLIVEYDTDRPTPPWVPYPLSFQALQPFFVRHGLTSVQKLGERISAYRRANMYAAWIGMRDEEWPSVIIS